MKNIIISANEYESTNTFDENDLSPHLMNVLNRTTRRNRTIKVGSNKDYNTKDLNDKRVEILSLFKNENFLRIRVYS